MQVGFLWRRALLRLRCVSRRGSEQGSPEMPLWHAGYFELKRQTGQKDRRRAYYLPFNYLKECTDSWPGPGRELPPGITTRVRARCAGGLGATRQDLRIQALSPPQLRGPCSLCTAWQTFVSKTFALPIFLQTVFLRFEALDTHSLLSQNGI